MVKASPERLSKPRLAAADGADGLDQDEDPAVAHRRGDGLDKQYPRGSHRRSSGARVLGISQLNPCTKKAVSASPRAVGVQACHRRRAHVRQGCGHLIQNLGFHHGITIFNQSSPSLCTCF